MRILPGAIGSILLCLLPVPVAVAEQNASAVWSDLQARNPPGLEFSLRLTDPHSYREGELIRAEIRFPSQSQASAQQPPPASWQFYGLLLDPAKDCGTLASPCRSSMTDGFDKPGPMLRFGQPSGAPALSLNDYLPALRPARYRVAMLARKLLLTHPNPLTDMFRYAEPPEYAVSNVVEIEVVPATKAWADQAIASSVSNLKGPEPNTREEGEQRRFAVQQLRLLDTPAAWSAALALLPVEEEYVLLRGLEASRDPARVCELMQAVVPTPSQAVSSYYLQEMARICARANLPPAPPNATKPTEPSAEQKQYWAQYREYQQIVTAKAAATLAASLALKQGDAKAIAFQTLMERVQYIRNNEPRQPLPAWLPAVNEEFTKSYAQIDRLRPRHLLGLYATTLHSPDLVPLLESVLDNWKPGDYYEAPREALHYMHAIDPARAQARIVAEVKRARTWLDASQLDLLPASAAPFTDDELIEALGAAQRAGGWNPSLRMSALAKYASPEALPRIRAIYESQKDSCQPELIAYFVRVDPAYADRVFHSHPWDIHVEPPRCTGAYFARTPPIAMGPVLERYMAVYLMQGTVPLKRAAAQSLGRFGSPAAAEPLWDAFRYFHAYWNGKEAELAQNREGDFLEMDLRNAMARGRHWIATDADLRTIESLCISQQCKVETAQDLRTWQLPLRIEASSQPGAVHGRVAQYYGIESMEALEEKLAQFPKGTRFVLTVHGDDAERATAHIQTYANAHGLSVDENR
jgi:hypothetical protein